MSEPQEPIDTAALHEEDIYWRTSHTPSVEERLDMLRGTAEALELMAKGLADDVEDHIHRALCTMACAMQEDLKAVWAALSDGDEAAAVFGAPCPIRYRPPVGSDE